jgi:hypothetical protein
MTTATQVANTQVLEWARLMPHTGCLPWLRRNTTCLASVASKNKAQVVCSYWNILLQNSLNTFWKIFTSMSYCYLHNRVTFHLSTQWYKIICSIIFTPLGQDCNLHILYKREGKDYGRLTGQQKSKLLAGTTLLCSKPKTWSPYFVYEKVEVVKCTVVGPCCLFFSSILGF